MYCIHCGKPYPDGANFCMACGARIKSVSIAEDPDVSLLPQEASLLKQENQPVVPILTDAPIQPEPPSPPVCTPQAVKMGSLKVPMIILAVLSAVGLLLFLLFPTVGDSQQTPSEGYSASDGEDMPWFSHLFGSLYFNEFLYTGAEEVTIPEIVNGSTVTTIGYSCFYDCDSITTVILPDTLKTIEGAAFYDCGALRGIFIPEGVTYIGEEAFAYCTALEAIAIPSSIETLDATAFDGCTSLKYVYFSGTVAQWREIYSGTAQTMATVYCTDGQCGLGYKE